MHYRLVAKTADFTPEELLNKLQGFMPVADEAVHQSDVGNLHVMPILQHLPPMKALIAMKPEPLMSRTAFCVSTGLLLEMITKSMKKYQPILTALSLKASDVIKMSLLTRAVFMPLFPRPEIFIT